MADENEKPPEQGSDQGNAAPTYVTPDQLKASLDPLSQSLQTLNASLAALASARNADIGGRTIEVPDITDAEIADDLRVGSTKKLLEKQKRDMNALLAAQLEPAKAAVVQTLNKLTGKIMAKNPDMPHYDRYRKEIDAELSKLPPAQRADPEAHEICYKLVVGAHTNDLIREASEAAVRNQRDKAPTGTPGASSGRDAGTGDGKVPSVAELFGPDAQAALESTGKTPDSFAKTQGFSNWEEMAKSVQTSTAGKG